MLTCKIKSNTVGARYIAGAIGNVFKSCERDGCAQHSVGVAVYEDRLVDDYSVFIPVCQRHKEMELAKIEMLKLHLEGEYPIGC